MPRKLRLPKVRVGELSPALTYHLLMGPERDQLAPRRLPGWCDLATLLANRSALQAIWDEHATDLRAIAHHSGFSPWFSDPAMVTSERAAWAARYLDEHGY